MSPSKSARQDVSLYSGDLVLLQKLEEVESSVKVKPGSTFILFLFIYCTLFIFMSSEWYREFKA